MTPLGKVSFLAVHCSDTKSTMNVTKSDLYKWHVTERGWSDIGYHWFVKFDGSIIPCRDEANQGAHCKAINDKSIAICLEGGHKGQYNFTEVQLKALKYLLLALKAKHKSAAVVGHNQFDDKDCPVINITEWWESNC
jgi:N-acetylmuramoyl-L-alanine amidase